MTIASLARANLLSIVAAYRKATGSSLSQVSKDFYGNGTFFAQLRRGPRAMSIEKLDDMLVHFRAQWPPNTPWPFVRAIHMGKTVQE